MVGEAGKSPPLLCIRGRRCGIGKRLDNFKSAGTLIVGASKFNKVGRNRVAYVKDKQHEIQN